MPAAEPSITVGCKVFVEKNGEKRQAEVLSAQIKKGKQTYYVHYVEFNKRLDEWIAHDRVDLTMEIVQPAKAPPAADSAGQKRSAANLKNANATRKKSRKLTDDASGGKENVAPGEDTGDELDEHADDVMDLDDIKVNGTSQELNREDEIEKLRTSGSMTQNHSEVARVRNVSKIIMGSHEVEPWYFSPYPIELTEEDEIYICEFSLCYFGSKKQFERFRSKCTLQHPPGNEIYRDGDLSFWEIDGRRQRTWCRNLCLLSKLFLDHKTLYYDVDPFLFYCMTIRDDTGHHLVGYFSKEKESAEGYNVACILTLPQYQRHGFGRVLIEFSYNLSMKEGKNGSPEKPLSDLGLLSYRAYWSDTIVELLVKSSKTDITIEDIASATAMTTTDILHTLQTLSMLKYYKGQHIICLTDAVMEKYDKQKQKQRRRIDAKKLIWKPPVFTAAQLRFGF